MNKLFTLTLLTSLLVYVNGLYADVGTGENDSVNAVQSMVADVQVSSTPTQEEPSTLVQVSSTTSQAELATPVQVSSTPNDNPAQNVERGLTEAQVEAKIDEKTSLQQQELDLIKRQIRALDSQNNQLRGINEQLRQKYDHIVDVNVQTSNRLQEEAKLRESSDAKLFIKEQEVRSVQQSKNRVEQDLRDFLSSDVDVWRVIANKIRVLKEYKDRLVESTQQQVDELQTSLNTSKETLKQKREQLQASKNNALAKYAQRNRAVSQLMDANLQQITKELDSLADQIDKLANEKDQQLFDKEQNLMTLKQSYLQDIEENDQQKQARLQAIGRAQEIEEGGFSEQLSQDNSIVSTFEEQKTQLNNAYEAQSEALNKQYEQDLTSLNNQLTNLITEYDLFVEKERADFSFTATNASNKVVETKAQLDKVESYIALIDRTADQRLEVLKQGHELRRNNFLSKQDNLKKRISELEKAAQEVVANNREREYALNLRKTEIEAQIVDLSAAEAAVKRAELDVINKQIDVLQGIFASVSQANGKVKNIFTDTLEKQTVDDVQENEIYQKAFKEINGKRATIVQTESNRLSMVRVAYQDALDDLNEKQNQNQRLMTDKENIFNERKTALEKQISDLNISFVGAKEQRDGRYESELNKIGNTIVDNTETRNRILRKRDAQRTLSEIQKANISRHFATLKERIDSVYEADKKVIESNIERINEVSDRRIALLKERKERLMGDREQNEMGYNNKREKYTQMRDDALENLAKLERDINELESKVEQVAYEQITALEDSRDKSLQDFNVNVANLEKAQEAFERFASTQNNLDSERRNIKELMANIMENFNLLSSDEFASPAGVNLKTTTVLSDEINRSLPDLPTTMAADLSVDTTQRPVSVVKPERQKTKQEKKEVIVLQDIVGSDSRPFVPQYKLIKAGCFIPDVMDKNVQSEQVCVNNDFYIANHEVTNEQYRQYKPNHQSGTFNDLSLNVDDMPVVNISWLDAIDYANWLSKQTGDQYRLPTDAEWEYAARGGSTGPTFYPSDKAACFYANVADLSVKKENPAWQTHPCLDNQVVASAVGSYRPNNYGLYDVLGNVWEWSCPRYETLPSGKKVCVSINAPDSDLKISRGGSWFSSPKSVRFGFKYGNYATFAGKHVGFRLVREK